MSLVLRVDVDKPYGRANIKEKIFSKVRENYWLPALNHIGYLRHAREFLSFLSEEKISSHIYFRTCTLPPVEWLNDKLLSTHSLGYHAEDTRSFETLKKEFQTMQPYFNEVNLTSFTKHGSGKWKSGKNHYPLYEPDKYLLWAEQLGIPFLFGNEEVHDPAGFRKENDYYPAMFWIDRWVHNDNFEWVLDSALNKNVVVIIHPSNFAADMRVNKNMRELITLSQNRGIPWITL